MMLILMKKMNFFVDLLINEIGAGFEPAQNLSSDSTLINAPAQ